MPCPTYREFASIAEAAYHRIVSPTPGFVRVDNTHTETASGFKGAIFRTAAGAVNHTYVVGFAGTDTERTGGLDFRDITADAGFAGRRERVAANLVSPAARDLIQKGRKQLAAQGVDASSLVVRAIQMAGANNQVYVTGHSLGGGLAQLICSAGSTLKGVAFNAPTTSQLGIPAVPSSRFANINENDDPVSRGTARLSGGSHQGSTREVETGVSGVDAHSLAHLITHLGSGGSGANLGGGRPF